MSDLDGQVDFVTLTFEFLLLNVFASISQCVDCVPSSVADQMGQGCVSCPTALLVS